MPTPYSGGQLDLSDAPGGDFSLDDLFPNPEEPRANESAEANPVPDASQTPDTSSEEFFLKTTTGTVYKTRDEAIKGLSHKDEVIERLRAKYKEDLGVDPLDDRQPSPNRRQNNVPEPDIANDPVAFWNAQAKAIKENNPVEYMQVLDRWLQARMSPAMPAVQYGAVQQALDKVSTEIPNYRDFRTSHDFIETLDANPVLKQAVDNSESNFQFSNQLPDLYKLVYFVNQGRKANEIMRSNPTPTPPTSVARPTVTPSTPTPQPTSGSNRPDLSTSAGRKAIIEAAERRGTADAAWTNVGF